MTNTSAGSDSAVDSMNLQILNVLPKAKHVYVCIVSLGPFILNFTCKNTTSFLGSSKNFPPD